MAKYKLTPFDIRDYLNEVDARMSEEDFVLCHLFKNYGNWLLSPYNKSFKELLSGMRTARMLESEENSFFSFEDYSLDSFKRLLNTKDIAIRNVKKLSSEIDHLESNEEFAIGKYLRVSKLHLIFGKDYNYPFNIDKCFGKEMSKIIRKRIYNELYGGESALQNSNFSKELRQTLKLLKLNLSVLNADFKYAYLSLKDPSERVKLKKIT